MKSKYSVISKHPDRVVIKDCGPWNRYATVTNNAEQVVEELFNNGYLADGARLFYYDSEGNFDEILIENCRFAGFAPGGR